MKCPKCGFNSFEFLDSCKKCGNNLINFKQAHGVQALILPLGVAVETAAAAETEAAGDPGGELLGADALSWEAPEPPTAAAAAAPAGRYVDFSVDLPPDESADESASLPSLMAQETEESSFAEFSFGEETDQEFVAADESGGRSTEKST